MERVVLVNQSTGYLMIDIVNAYASRYEHVALIAGSVKQNERQLSKNVQISSIIAYNRSSRISRLMTWVIGAIQIVFLLLFRYRGWKVIYVTNPPMSYLSSLLLRQKFSVIVYDIYPEALQSIGIKKTNFIYKLWQSWNCKLFARADGIYTLSLGMKRQLANYCSEDKIRIIPNWSASSQLRPIEKSKNPFLQQLGLCGKFVVMYSGNIGYTHRVECIIEIAKRVSHDSDIQFVIIGEGAKKEEMIKMAHLYGLKNCHFLTWQTPEVMPFSLAAADVAVITLNDDASAVSVPSKTYNLLAVGAPLLCIASQSTELYQLVSQFKNGSCFDYDKIEEMSEFILKLKSNPNILGELSQNSCNAAQYYTYKNAEQYV